MDINHTQSQCRCSYHQRVQADAGVQGCDLREDENGDARVVVEKVGTAWGSGKAIQEREVK